VADFDAPPPAGGSVLCLCVGQWVGKVLGQIMVDKERSHRAFAIRRHGSCRHHQQRPEPDPQGRSLRIPHGDTRPH